MGPAKEKGLGAHNTQTPNSNSDRTTEHPENSPDAPSEQGPVEIGIITKRIVAAAFKRMKARQKFARGMTRAELRGRDWGDGFQDSTPSEVRQGREDAKARRKAAQKLVLVKP